MNLKIAAGPIQTISDIANKIQTNNNDHAKNQNKKKHDGKNSPKTEITHKTGNIAVITSIFGVIFKNKEKAAKRILIRFLHKRRKTQANNKNGFDKTKAKGNAIQTTKPDQRIS